MRNIQYISERNLSPFQKRSKKAIMRHCNSSRTNDNSPFQKSFGSIKKNNVDSFQWASIIYTWIYVQEDKFVILWDVLQVFRNAILKFVPSLKHEWGMRGNSLKITLPQKGSNTRYLEREELMQNTWVPSKGQTKITSVTDFIKFRFLLHMSRLIRIGTFHWPDFSGKFYYL